MKKLIAYIFAFAFAVVLVFSVVAFTNDGPKKCKAETAAITINDSAKTTTAHCNEQIDSTCQQKEAKGCCKKAGQKSEAGCPNAEDCKHYMESQVKK